ncbi:MAG: hypothetical protein IAG10_06695 [Planctomycetaceae bacterium]|nr:hypothetical protein [Planctomycetaceae bacterium]
MTSHIQFGHQSCSSWLSWAAVSLGCVSGCASWDQMAQNIAHPWRASGDMIARTNDRVSDAWDSEATRSRKTKSAPASQLAQKASPTTPTANPTVLPASMPVSAPVKPLTPAPADVELLPAPPVSPTSATAAAPASTTASTNEAPANTTWCRVRVRNIGSQPATQVAVSVSSPAHAPLVSKEGTVVSRPTQGKMEFAPVAQVGAKEEVILLVGVATSDERANRLRVQIRDAQGGTNQELQARWQIAIEAAE